MGRHDVGLNNKHGRFASPVNLNPAMKEHFSMYGGSLPTTRARMCANPSCFHMDSITMHYLLGLAPAQQQLNCGHSMSKGKEEEEKAGLQLQPTN